MAWQVPSLLPLQQWSLVLIVLVQAGGGTLQQVPVARVVSVVPVVQRGVGRTGLITGANGTNAPCRANGGQRLSGGIGGKGRHRAGWSHFGAASSTQGQA